MASPTKQFEIVELFHFSVGGINLSVTNASAWMAAAVCVSVVFFFLASSQKSMIPGRLQMCGEIVYEFIFKMVRENIGAKGHMYFPFIFSLFVFILAGNVLGLLPYSFTFTSHLAVTGALALTVFISIFAFGLYNHGFKFFTLFIPAGAPVWLFPLIIPIEIISFFVRPFTLSVRLFANMMAGHIMLKVVAGFAVAGASMGGLGILLSAFPVLVNFALMAFELLVAVIQAYVFAILSCVYLKDSVELHH